MEGDDDLGRTVGVRRGGWGAAGRSWNRSDTPSTSANATPEKMGGRVVNAPDDRNDEDRRRSQEKGGVDVEMDDGGEGEKRGECGKG